MKYFFKIILCAVLFFYSTGTFSQVITGGGGVTIGTGDPNGITSIAARTGDGPYVFYATDTDSYWLYDDAQIAGSKWVIVPMFSLQTTTLADGSIWIGNGANVATAIVPTGAVSITNAGVTAMTATAVNDQVNGFDIDVTTLAGAISIAPDFTELVNIAAPDVTSDRLILYDVTGITHGFITPDQLASSVNFYSVDGTIDDAVRTVTFTNATTTDLIFTDAVNELMRLTDAGTTGTLAVSGNTTVGLDLTVTGNDIIFGNAETISNATDGIILLTSPTVQTSANLDVDGDVNIDGGNITTSISTAWQVLDNAAVGLDIGAAGATDMMRFVTTNIAESVDLTLPGGLRLAAHGAAAGNTTQVSFFELAANGANYVAFKSPDDGGAVTEIYTLPADYPTTNGEVLTSTTAGVLSWSAAGGANTNIMENSITMTVLQVQTLLDNIAAAQTFGAAGAASMMVFNTTDGSEAVEFGNAITVAGTSTLNGIVNIGDAATDDLIIADDDVVFTNLQFFFDNAAAVTGGIPVNGMYALPLPNGLGLPRGVAMFRY